MHDNTGHFGPQTEAIERLKQAYAYKANNEIENALSECEEVNKLAPNWADPHFLRGLLLESLGRDAESEKAFSEAFRLDPSLHNMRSEPAGYDNPQGYRQYSTPAMVRALREQSFVPWTASDVWLGFAFFIALSIVIFGMLILLAPNFSVDLSLALMITVGELPLLIPVWWFVLRRHGYDWYTLGFRKFKWIILAIALALLFAFYIFSAFWASFLAIWDLQPQPDMGTLTDDMTFPWLLIIGTVIFAPLLEEVFFRGFVFAGFRQRYGWQKGALISSAMFAIVHLQPLAFPPLFLMGYILAFIYQRSNSIWPCIILHFVVNGLAMLVEFLVDVD